MQPHLLGWAGFISLLAMLKPLFAILLDGGFVVRKLRERLGRHPEVEDILNLCGEISGAPPFEGYELLRIHFYDAPPSRQLVRRPVSGQDLDLSLSDRAKRAQSLHDQLELTDGFVLRMGETRIAPWVWALKPGRIRQMVQAPRPFSDSDFELDISQKGVDIRIGLDMAKLCLGDKVRALAVVTADSDFVPAFKFVRREGVKIMLCSLGHKGTRRELKVHADFVLS